MSRAAIPSNKKMILSMLEASMRIFVSKKSFAEFSSHKKTPIEFIEDLEILRFLELTIKNVKNER